jgi:flagellar motor switch protein FliN/FliY
MAETPADQEQKAGSQEATAVTHFLDIPLKVRIQLGQRYLKIREILLLKEQSIIELPKSAGENIDILVNGKLVAFGEVLEMEGNAGIRLTNLKI